MADFSTEAAEELFARYPDWRKYARSEKENNGRPFVRLEVPAPAEANAIGGLIVSTENEEVTVEFDYYHSHFDEMVGGGGNFGTKAALAFIEQLLDERVAAVSWWNGDQWRGSATIERGKSLKQATSRALSTGCACGLGEGRSMPTLTPNSRFLSDICPTLCAYARAPKPGRYAAVPGWQP